MFLAAQGFLIFSPQSSLLLMKPRKTKITAHWLLMLLAMCFTVGGECLKQLCLSVHFCIHCVVHCTVKHSYINFRFYFSCHQVSSISFRRKFNFFTNTVQKVAEHFRDWFIRCYYSYLLERINLGRKENKDNADRRAQWVSK